MTAFQNMGKYAALAMNRSDSESYVREREACHRAIQRLQDDDKLQARQEFDHAYRQYRSKKQ